MKKRLGLAVLILATLLFQNCGAFKAMPGGFSSDSSTSSAALAILQPATDRIDSTCFTNTAYDACIFNKNPVAQMNASWSGSIATSVELDSMQIYGVKLSGLDGSGRLSNSTIALESVRGTTVAIGRSTLKSNARGDKNFITAQINAYYWMNRSLEYISARTGIFPAAGKAIRVVADDSVTGWSPTTNSIHLKVDASGQAMAWSGELAVHFLGLANLEYAGAGQIRTALDTRHKTCGLKTYGCCTDATGCGRAIASGVGDYFAAMVFPQKPIIGETWANQTLGLGFCNISRSLEDAKFYSASSAYNACSASGLAGETSTMGTIYASIWWEIRKAAELAKPGKGSIDIDRLFMSHLSKLRGDDNFASSYSKIVNLEASLYGGAYASIIQAKFAGRI